MKRQGLSDVGLLAGRNCLGHTCGTNIDTEDVEFTNQQPNLTYIDKVFSFNKDIASPLLFNLNTGGMSTNNFVVRFFLDGSSLFPCTLSPNAVFEIDNSFVAVEYFNTRPPGNITAAQVTVDGFPVDSVSFTNGQYTAVTTNVLPQVQNNRCLDRGLPTKTFFLISNAGPWDFRATYVLEGTVNTNGRLCRFRAEISNAPGTPNSMLPSGSLSSFAVPNLSLPCAINGVAPNILFQFSAKINLVNPRLVVNCGLLTANNIGSAEEAAAGELACQSIIGPILSNNCRVSLVSTLAVEPVVHVETVRRTLFCINACEGLQPCDGSVRAAEIEDAIEECVIGGVDRPDCRCRKGRGGRSSDVRGAADNTRNSLADIVGVNNQDVGGVTVGAGTCEDCVWGETRGHNCRPCKKGREDVAGTRDGGRNEVAGIRERGSHRDFRNDVLGTTDKILLKKLLEEIREELAEDDTSDVAGIGYGPDGTFGIGDEEDLGVSERIRDIARTASRLHGSNGCSW